MSQECVTVVRKHWPGGRLPESKIRCLDRIGRLAVRDGRALLLDVVAAYRVLHGASVGPAILGRKGEGSIDQQDQDVGQIGTIRAQRWSR